LSTTKNKVSTTKNAREGAGERGCRRKGADNELDCERLCESDDWKGRVQCRSTG
jgi:hypothetical protein